MLTKTGRIIAIIMLSVFLTACGRSAEMVETPASIHLERGRNYKEVIEKKLSTVKRGELLGNK